MIVRQKLSLKIVVQLTWKRVLFLAVYASVIVFLYQSEDQWYLALPPLPATVMGTALGILLGFRNNSAYNRWWEARTLWGRVVNESRTFARQIISFVSTGVKTAELRAVHTELVYRQIAFAHALRCHLRKQPPLEDLKPFLDASELEGLQQEQNVPNALLQRQSVRLQELHVAGCLDDFRQMKLDERLTSLCDAQGGCERIKNTVFPRQYSRYTVAFVWIFIMYLPFALIKDLGYLAVPASVIVSFVFLVLSSLAGAIENPFENTINDTPMTALSRTIEINLRQQLGETALPPAIQPVDGFLY
ncbi:MAG: hypothetical protein IAF08_12810 [Rhizobacter sp.]|nr:hypothetical protein [Chlorobiales bacterium]